MYAKNGPSMIMSLIISLTQLKPGCTNLYKWGIRVLDCESAVQEHVFRFNHSLNSE